MISSTQTRSSIIQRAYGETRVSSLQSAPYQISEMSQNSVELKSMLSFPVIFHLSIPRNGFIEMQLRSVVCNVTAL